MPKSRLVNFLFVLSFPFYGVGNYVSATFSPSAGYILSVSMHLFIIIFYLIDLAYRREFHIRLNGWFFAAMALLLLNIISLARALANHLPDENIMMLIAKSVMLASPFLAFVIVGLYNAGNQQRLPRLTFQSLSLLILINLVGYYGLGLSNEVHSIENRLNFPFLDGFYSGACILAILNLMIIYYLGRSLKNPLLITVLLVYFLLNSAMLFMINSRISILIFIMIAILLLLNVLHKVKGLLIASLFTIPILLSSSLVLYEILSLPFFTSVLQRVDLQDVTTFNGRSYIWENAMNWLLHDQRGLFFGNGYKGHYFLDLISDVARLWNEKDLHHMHLHSTSFEILTSQGLVEFGVFMLMMFQILRFYRHQYRTGHEQGIFFAVTVFLLFICQVDTFVYLEASGGVIFSLLFASVVIRSPSEVDRSAIHRVNYSPAEATQLRY